MKGLLNPYKSTSKDDTWWKVEKMKEFDEKSQNHQVASIAKIMACLNQLWQKVLNMKIMKNVFKYK